MNLFRADCVTIAISVLNVRKGRLRSQSRCRLVITKNLHHSRFAKKIFSALIALVP